MPLVREERILEETQWLGGPYLSWWLFYCNMNGCLLMFVHLFDLKKAADVRFISEERCKLFLYKGFYSNPFSHLIAHKQLKRVSLYTQC